ncbi:spore coat protein [Candidatus Woesearchaeota archaeon]|nr:MAG: spore coat protein [Candidatus Woesearchaeota archaeon]
MIEFAIGNKRVGGNNPCFLVAEIGINHNGKISIAKKLIEEAAKAGFDAIKLQTFKVNKLFHKDAGTVKFSSQEYSIREVNKRFELPEEWLPELKRYANEMGLVLFSSVCDEGSADILHKYGFPAYKLTSTAITHHPLQVHVARLGKPVILSTGASTLQEVREAYETVTKYNPEVALLHCVVCYPTPLEYANLLVIRTLADNFPKAVIGFSDHTEHPYKAPVGAIAMGAKIIEKHITLDKNMEGPDHFFALNPEQMRLMVREVRRAEDIIRNGGRIEVDKVLLGSPKKVVYDIEQYSKRFSNRCIYAAKDLRKGEKLTKEKLEVLRPGNKARGLPPKYYFPLIRGEYILVNDIKAHEPITIRDIERVK